MPFTVQGTPIGAATIGTGLLASMGGFLFGYDTGMISGLVLMDDFLLRFASCTEPGNPASCAFGVYQEGTIVALLSVGTLVGALVGAPIADLLGRRKAMTLECLVFSIGIIIQLATFTVWQQIAVGRLISGFGVGALSIAVPIYQSETLPKQLRGAIVSTYQLAITAGILLAALVNLGSHTLEGAKSWRLTIGLALVFSTFLGVGILFCPESPRWLALRHRDEEAIRSLARVRGVSGEVKGGSSNAYVDQDWREVADGVRFLESMPKAGWLDCFKVQNKTLYRTVMGIMLQAGQQLTGANYFFCASRFVLTSQYFGATLFSSSGASINGYQAQCILNAVNFVCTFGGIYIMQRFGRRWPLIIGGIGNAVWLIVFAASGVAKDPTQNQGIAKLLIISACFFIVSYATTWAPGVWCLMGESFSARTRAKQSGLSTASNWLWNFMIAFFTTPIVSNIGYAYGFVFAGANLFMRAVGFRLFRPLGLSLEAVDMIQRPGLQALDVDQVVSARLRPPHRRRGFREQGGRPGDPRRARLARRARRAQARPQGRQERRLIVSCTSADCLYVYESAESAMSLLLPSRPRAEPTDRHCHPTNRQIGRDRARAQSVSARVSVVDRHGALTLERRVRVGTRARLVGEAGVALLLSHRVELALLLLVDVREVEDDHAGRDQLQAVQRQIDDGALAEAAELSLGHGQIARTEGLPSRL